MSNKVKLYFLYIILIIFLPQLVYCSGELGPWQLTSSMRQGRSIFQAVTRKNFIFVVGGDYLTNALSGVERANINPDGHLSSWSYCSSLNAPRSGGAAFVWDDSIYVMAGISTTGYLATIERSMINGDGTLGVWKVISNSCPLRYLHASVLYNNYIYLIGGYISEQLTSTIVRGEIDPNGNIESWSVLSNSLPKARESSTAVAYNGYLYVLGGVDSTGSSLKGIERALINSNGKLGPWQNISSTRNFPIACSAVIAAGYLYVLGGFNYPSLNKTVEKAKILSNGELDEWETVSSMTIGRELFSTLATQNCLYALGGFNGSTDTRSVEYAPYVPMSIKQEEWQMWE
jgi:hypothetical protein